MRPPWPTATPGAFCPGAGSGLVGLGGEPTDGGRWAKWAMVPKIIYKHGDFNDFNWDFMGSSDFFAAKNHQLVMFQFFLWG